MKPFDHDASSTCPVLPQPRLAFRGDAVLLRTLPNRELIVPWIAWFSTRKQGPTILLRNKGRTDRSCTAVGRARNGIDGMATELMDPRTPVVFGSPRHPRGAGLLPSL